MQVGDDIQQILRKQCLFNDVTFDGSVYIALAAIQDHGDASLYSIELYDNKIILYCIGIELLNYLYGIGDINYILISAAHMSYTIPCTFQNCLYSLCTNAMAIIIRDSRLYTTCETVV